MVSLCCPGPISRIVQSGLATGRALKSERMVVSFRWLHFLGFADSLIMYLALNRSLASFLLLSLILVQAGSAGEKDRPNILLILADDLGFSDLGCYGGEIQTPNLDRLAANGVRFSQFYNTARCWPTRASILTGYYPQQVRRDNLPGIKRGKRPDWAPLIPERLKPAGYRCYHSGKWHLDGMPLEGGFDRSYLTKDQGRYFYPQVLWLDDKKLAPVPRTDNPFGDGFYLTTSIADHAIECLQDHFATHREQPFFQYLAFTAPHFPLQALPEDIRKYQGQYDIGWDEIRSRRWKRIKQLGFIQGELSKVEYDIGPPYDFPEAIRKLGTGEINRPRPWNQLTEDQKRFQATKMAIHAAMVDRMDQEIGRVLKQLESMQALRNTLILFLSDNGASAEIMVRADGHDPTVPPGSGPSYLCLGPGWSTFCNTPFRRHKTWVHEGGIHTPLIAHWPDGMKKNPSRSSWIHSPGHVIDLVPTLTRLTGQDAVPVHNGPKLPGISLQSELVNGKTSLLSRTLWWSHEGNRALRVGNKKIVAAKDKPWSLFDLGIDPTEQNDLAHSGRDRSNQKLIREMESIWVHMESSFSSRLKKSR